MARSLALLMVGAAMAVGGCVTPAKFLDSKEPMAVKTAVTRGQFELNCPAGRVHGRRVRLRQAHRLYGHLSGRRRGLLRSGSRQIDGEPSGAHRVAHEGHGAPPDSRVSSGGRWEA